MVLFYRHGLVRFEVQLFPIVEKKAAIRQQIQFLCEGLEILPLNQKSASIFGTLKRAIQETRMWSSKNIKQHNVDIMIAVNAIWLNGAVVSEDKLFTVLVE